MTPRQREVAAPVRPLLLGACVGLALLTGCRDDWVPSFAEIEKLNGLWGLPPPQADPTNRLTSRRTKEEAERNEVAVALGEALFNDVALSGCGTVSCASCHEAAHGYTHATPTIQACHPTEKTGRNAPATVNMGHELWFMWDGRADRLWSQTILPMLSPVEMAATPQGVRALLEELPAYKQKYVTLFGKAPAEEEDLNRVLANTGKALAAYMYTLNTGESAFDVNVRRFVEATKTDSEQNDPIYLGLKVFMQKGNCIACHSGPSLSDGKFHSVGVKDTSEGREGRLAGMKQLLASPFRADGLYSDDPNAGIARNRLTNFEREFNEAQELNTQKLRQEYKGAFKTPTLRNITLTAPYMHTGEYATLEDVVELYSKGGEAPDSHSGEVNPLTIHKLDLTPEEKRALVELLESMTAPLR
jgi:cytochrome c peroxidase